MEPIAAFKSRIGVESLQFLKKNGREFCPTSAGTLFMSASFKKGEPAFVMVNDGSMAGKAHLAGSLWVVNIGATASTIL